jgi:hypothetical protein
MMEVSDHLYEYPEASMVDDNDQMLRRIAIEAAMLCAIGGDGARDNFLYAFEQHFKRSSEILDTIKQKFAGPDGFVRGDNRKLAIEALATELVRR